MLNSLPPEHALRPGLKVELLGWLFLSLALSLTRVPREAGARQRPRSEVSGMFFLAENEPQRFAPKCVPAPAVRRWAAAGRETPLMLGWSSTGHGHPGKFFPQKNWEREVPLQCRRKNAQ